MRTRLMSGREPTKLDTMVIYQNPETAWEGVLAVEGVVMVWVVPMKKWEDMVFWMN